MQQIPIEEVLVELRKKYAAETSETAEDSEEFEEADEIESEAEQIEEVREIAAFRSIRSKSRHWTFLRIVAAQGIAAIIVALALLAARLVNPDLFEYLLGLLKA